MCNVDDYGVQSPCIYIKVKLQLFKVVQVTKSTMDCRHTVHVKLKKNA